MDIKELFRRYELVVQAQGFSLKTISHVENCVSLFLKYLGDTCQISDVTADDLRRFISSLRDRKVWEGMHQSKRRKLISTTINTYVRAIKSFWSWLKREGLIDKNPIESVPAPKKARTIPKVYSENQLRAILEAVPADSRERAIIEVLLDSGMRLSELVGLSVSSVDMQTGRIKVFGKGGKERYTHISSPTIKTLATYLTKLRPKPVREDRLFLTRGGTTISSQRVQNILEFTGKKADITERLSAHKLRHTYATPSLKYGNNLVL